MNINVLDQDDGGPAFGEAALTALSNEGRPLHSSQIVFRHVPYDWSRWQDLKSILEAAQSQRALVICSSEGGLFEYGSDQDIAANLRILRAFPEVLAVVGSVTRADEPAIRLRQTSPAALQPRGWRVFGELAGKVGWRVDRVIERPFADQVLLR